MGYTFILMIMEFKLKGIIADGYFYDKDSGVRQDVPRDQFVKVGDKLYYFDSKGQKGNKTIDGKDYYILNNGEIQIGRAHV